DKVQMIRHRMTPRIGISYTPDFGTPFWGYYGQLDYTDASGVLRHEDYSLYSDGHLFGAPGRGKSAAITFGLDNNLEMKVRSKSDSTETFKKISLIDNFSLNTSYNLAADSFQLSDISASIALRLSQSFQLSLSGSFDPYLYGHTTSSSGQVQVHRVNKLRMFNGKGIGSLRGTGTSFSYTLNNQTFQKIKEAFGGKKKDKNQRDATPQDSLGTTPPLDGKDSSLADQAKKNQQAKSLFESSSDDGEYDEDGYLKVSIPWSLSFSYGVNLQRTTFDTRRDEYRYGLTHSLMLSGSIQPTKNWSFNFNASYDFIAKRLANMTIGISRDLHCWTLAANAIPFGPYRSYSISIGVKSGMLQDVKWDKHGYSSGNSF
ncbi:MAG: LPS-assembly protein LptD, partial [Porphyromonadaceae bacterium]|nr:LPS-assembly protein LptD [Porphyromonadaceae bacterium]